LSQNQLIELLTKVLADVSPGQAVGGAYLFAQTADNWQAVLSTGVALLRQGRTPALWIPHSEPRSGYSGFTTWQQALLARQVSAEQIIGIETAAFPSINTYIEALTAVRYARASGVTSLYIVAAPFHQLRAFITTVSILLAEYPALRVFNVAGQPMPWYETVRHSQGELQGRRESFIHTELERIATYQAKGDLVAPDQVLAYLRRRDGAG
jgi:hypothetical protein